MSISCDDNHYTTGTSIIESGDIRFITGIGGTVARDSSYAGVTVKCSTYRIEKTQPNNIYIYM